MPATAKTSAGAVGVCAGLSLLALLFYALQVATLADLAGSDPAGNAYAQAYGAVEIILLWLLLAVLMIIAAVKGGLPMPAVIAAVILIPASGFVAMNALELLSRPDQSPFLWPIVIPAAVPPLLVAFCFWTLLPSLRAAIPARVATFVVWGAVLVLCLAIVPFQQMRERALDNAAAAQEKVETAYAKLTDDAPLWDWLPLLPKLYGTQEAEARERIRKLARRQSDAELMLERGDFPLRYLGSLDLTPTPALCDKARGLLRRQVEPLVLKTPNSKLYSVIARQVSDAVIAMNWLVGYECACDAEALAWETMATAYNGTNFDVIDLARLRDPKALGRIVREYPERFSMLTPRAHLKAWLKFTDDKQFSAQALAGARKLEHRNADAIEMLRGDEHNAYLVMAYLPELDLEATTPLCNAALWVVHQQFAKVYRPRADDPRRYSELLERLGGADQFGDLIWLASHGCEADPQLSEAEDIIRSYQDSAARAKMLAALAELHRKR